MSDVIKDYYRKTKLEEFQVKNKLEMLDRHADIKEEFEYWLTHKCFMPNGITVEGYSAKSLSEISKFLNGEGAFIMLIKLRENPENAKKQITTGFKIK